MHGVSLKAGVTLAAITEIFKNLILDRKQLLSALQNVLFQMCEHLKLN